MNWNPIETGKGKWAILALLLAVLAIAGCESKVGPTEEAKDEQVRVIVVGGAFPVLGSLSRVSIAPRSNLFIGWNFNLEGIRSYAVSVGRYDGAGSYQPVWFVYNIPPTESGLVYSQRVPVGAVSSNSPPDLLDGDYRIFIDAYDQEFESSDIKDKKPIGRGGVTLLVGRGGFPNPDGNGTFATSLPLSLNRSVVSDIEQIYEVDVYSIDLAASQRISIDLTNLTGNLTFMLYDFNARELASAQKDGILSRSMSFTASTAATYYLKVLGEVTEVGSYELTAEDENDTFETADEIKLNTPLDGQINPPGDLDYYSISLSASEAMTFLLTRLGSDLDLSLYDKNKAKVKESKDNNLVTKEERISFTASASGTFYVEVRGYKSARGVYTIEARR
jgi:hypothetical protein